MAVPGSPEHIERCRMHFIRRAWQRRGIALGLAEGVQIEAKILNHEAFRLQDRGRGCRVYAVTFNKTRMHVLFDHKIGCAVTVLEPGWVGRKEPARRRRRQPERSAQA